MEIPLLVSRFPAMEHPQMDDITDDIKKFFKTDVFNILNKNTQQYGDYMGAGALYCAYIYPLGDTEKLKAISRFYCYWALIDDLFFDNSVDLDNIGQMIDRFIAALDERSNGDKLFAPITEFCSRTDWKNETKEIFKNEMKRYLKSVMSLRIIEVEKRQISTEEYLNYRHYNIAMWVIFSLLWHTQDNTDLSTFHSLEFAKIFEYSSICIGTLLDMYNLKARKEEIADYTNIVRVIQRFENCDEEEAINRSVQIFHEHEAKMEEAFNRLEAKYPSEILYFKHVESGSVRYCTESRKMRYMQHSDVDEDSTNGRTIV